MYLPQDRMLMKPDVDWPEVAASIVSLFYQEPAAAIIIVHISFLSI
jgi:hypothetical protein